MTANDLQNQPKGILDHLVSVFRGVKATDVVETVPLRDVLRRIQDGTYREAIAQVRWQRERSDGAYKRAKAALLSFTPCCALRTRAQRVPWSEKLISTTRCVHFDFDNVPDPAVLKSGLAANPATVFAFISPSEDGVKANIAVEGITDAESYKQAWRVVLRRLKKAYPDLYIRQDEHVKFLHALCFVSDDPDIYVNPDAVPLALPPRPLTKKRRCPRCVSSRAATSIPSKLLEHSRSSLPDGYDDWIARRPGDALDRPSSRRPHVELVEWAEYQVQAGGTSGQMEGFTQDGGRTLGDLYTLAHHHGWRPAGWGQEQAEGNTSQKPANYLRGNFPRFG